MNYKMNSVEKIAFDVAQGSDFLSTLKDDNELRRLKLSFAKSGVFNPLTLLDELKFKRHWSEGNVSDVRDYFLLHRYGINDPIVLKHVKMSLLKHDRRRRKNSYFYKSFTIKDYYSPIQLTPHAIARYRERSGVSISENLFWDSVVEQPSGLIKMSDNFESRFDLLQPTADGAWLGQAVMCSEASSTYSYTRKRGLAWSTTSSPIRGFRAYTWVPVSDFLDFQYNAWKAYKNGETARAIEIMSKNENQNQIKKIAATDITIFEYDN